MSEPTPWQPSSFGNSFTAQYLSASSGELKHRWAISLAWSLGGLRGRTAGMGGNADVNWLNQQSFHSVDTWNKVPDSGSVRRRVRVLPISRAGCSVCSHP